MELKKKCFAKKQTKKTDLTFSSETFFIVDPLPMLLNIQMTNLVKLAEQQGENPEGVKNGIEVNPSHPRRRRHQNAHSHKSTVLMEVVN